MSDTTTVSGTAIGAPAIVDSPVLHTANEVRAAEDELLRQQTRPDELMQSAARAVQLVAQKMLDRGNAPVLLLVGPGGNGGDALYAGAGLLRHGHCVTAWALKDPGATHSGAREAFFEAGGDFLPELPATPPSSALSNATQFSLIIDGLFGLQGRGGLPQDVAEFLARHAHTPVLAVDVPSGILTDTGQVQPTPPGQPPLHVVADETVTFGSLRRAHILNPDCGTVTCMDATLDDGRSLAETLSTGPVRGWWVGRGVPSFPDATSLPTEPNPTDDKYSGGVVGVCAGSAEYPGAGVLCSTAAVRVTSSMVRYVGTGNVGGAAAQLVIAANPEIVPHANVREAGRVQAWIVGPGRGTGAEAVAELADVLGREEPVVIDADGLTNVAAHAELRELIVTRGKSGRETLLTPHAGEFARLWASVGDGDQAAHGRPAERARQDRIAEAQALARTLRCTVLLKGRATILTDGERVNVVDAGSSWGATAGSGDVLSGIVSALLAAENGAEPGGAEHGGETVTPETDRNTQGSVALRTATTAVFIHSTAALLAAQTPYGPAPTSAARIAEHIPGAIAYLHAAPNRVYCGGGRG